MVSSTFTDLKEHRAAMIAAIHKHKLHANVMEHDDAKASGDVIESSLRKVRDSAAYILVIGFKYGQTPVCPKRNPKMLSITELEFDEAERLGRPIHLFIMGDDHPVTKSAIETNKSKEKTLNAFRERAKKSADTQVNRVYSVFQSLDDFILNIASSLSELCQLLDSQNEDPDLPAFPERPQSSERGIPGPPLFYAERDYIGRHNFIGRAAQIQTLNDWARSPDSNVLLFEAIGGNGKSMLTWHWAKDDLGRYSTATRSDWAGRFWYSFYEKGAIMRGFCQHALAYMTSQPLETFAKLTMFDLRKALLDQLHARPWLLVLDGLERVLVAYHRIDAAEVPDEEANHPTDKILDRNPCDAIRDEDTDLLRELASAQPSKILISSRLTPRVLLNPAGLPLPGVQRWVLPGLEDADAESLLRSCGVRGSSPDIRYYLTNYCGNHPLVIGVLAGLINSPGPHRGNFDAWAADPEYGAKLNLASLDLIQSRNHILRAALDALEPASRQLLSTLALLSNAVDYETVAAFNPHMPPEPKKLAETMQDLERRGLLQYDVATQRYDLHPVVRGVAAGAMKPEDKERYGQRVVDHFSSQPHNPYEQAKTLDDVEDGLHVVRTLLKLGRYQQAADAFRGDLSNALFANLEAYVEVLSILRPFFPSGWDVLPKDMAASHASYLSNSAACALNNCGEIQKALEPYQTAVQVYLKSETWSFLRVSLSNIGRNLSDQNMQFHALRVSGLALDLATAIEDDEAVFNSRLSLLSDQSRLGQWQAAEATWRLLDPMGRNWRRATYRQGSAEYHFALFRFWHGTLQDEYLTTAATLAERDGNRTAVRYLHRMRGALRLEQGEWAFAAASFDSAVTMARERRLVDAESETGLALAKHHLGQLTGEAAHREAARLAQLRRPAQRYLAMLWRAIGDFDKAQQHALAAYKWSWADGEPYVNRYELTKTTELLQQMSVSIPQLPPYDPAKDEPFPWEAEVRAAIDKLRAKKEANKAK